MLRLKAIFLTILLFSQAHSFEVSGLTAIDYRQFYRSASLPGQNSNNIPSFVLEPEIYFGGQRATTFTFRPFARIDTQDANRRHFDIRQLDLLYSPGSWELKAGIGKVFWGVVESNHLIDIINQTDLVEDVDFEDKLGQPMIQLALLKDWGSLRLFYLPYFRERTFPSFQGRLRNPTIIETNRATFQSSAKNLHPDFAIRYEHTIGNWDFGIAHFSGTSREPTLLSSTNNDGQDIFIPNYELIDQSSIDIQLTYDAWLVKLEAFSRTGHRDRFFAMATGLEYSFFDIQASGADYGILLEFHRDSRGIGAPQSLFDNDIFIGNRIVLNDKSDTQFLGGVIFDTNSYAKSYNIEFSRRLSENFKIEIDLRINDPSNIPSTDFGSSEDSHLQIRLARYF